MRGTAFRPIFVLAVVTLSLAAQTAPKAPTPEKPAAPAIQVQSDLLQLMRGVIYPAANVVFASQNDDPAKLKPPAGQDPALATDPLVSTFGGWRAVENASLALAESANLLLIPGRQCADGLPVPLSNPDWAKFVEELRDAGMKAYKAAQTKNQDNMIEASDTMNAACLHCHAKWRDRRGTERCK